MREITELDHKYLVFKWEDIQELPLDIKEKVAFIQGYIETFRHGKGKKDNKYLVLNLDDEISIPYINTKIQNIISERMYGRLFKQKTYPQITIKDIAVDLVNAILKAKEKAAEKRKGKI